MLSVTVIDLMANPKNVDAPGISMSHKKEYVLQTLTLTLYVMITHQLIEREQKEKENSAKDLNLG